MDGDEEPTNIVFSETKVLHKGAATPLSLSSNGIIRWAENGEQLLSAEKDVLGFATDGSDVEIKALLEAKAGLLCGASTGPLVRKSFIFRFLSDDGQSLFCSKLRQFFDSIDRPKRLFVFVNPFGGKKSASKIYADQVKPLMDDANMQVTLQETQHQLHAKELAKTMDLTKYDGIVCVSGDGILVEVVNGLLERKDWRAAIKTPLGVVPAGTGNGMAKSLTDSVGEPCTAANAVLAIIRGHTRSLDVTTVLQGNIKFFSVLMLAWGLVADIDIESEKYRWMGSARLDLYGLQRIMNLRLYNGNISFVPAPGFEEYGEPSSYKSKSSSSDHVSDEDIKVRHGYQGPRVSLESMNWRKVTGPFASVWLHNVTWGSEDTMAAPNAQFSDGNIDLIYMKDVSKLALLSLMSELNNGNHVKSPHVVYLKVKAFVLEPGQRVDKPAKGGIIDSDGEVLARGSGTYKCDQNTLMAYDKLEMIVDQGLATLYCPM